MIPRKDSLIEELVYAACAIDCEGCICLSRGKNYNRRSEEYHNYNGKIIVGNTNRVLIDWLYETFGGLRQVRLQSHSSKFKDCYLWTLYGKAAIAGFLQTIRPYLKMKTEQADLMLEFIALGNVSNPGLREEFFQRMKALNLKGKSVTTNTPNTSDRKETGSRVVKIESDLTGDRENASGVIQK